MTDVGFFGPDSLTWKVNQEMFALFGGARALLMQAAHPLISAGARQTGFYSRDPWGRLIRTLQLQNAITFGSKEEAQAAADRINKLHLKINGTDPVTGMRYDAVDPDLLLWVHASLEDSTIFFYEKAVRPLSPAERQQYHQENLLAAEMVWLPRDKVPANFEGLREYIDEVVRSGDLMLTDVALEVFDLIQGGPVPPHIKPVWKFIAFAAKGTLPSELQQIYNVTWDARRQRWLDLNLAAMAASRRFLPKPLRLIGPARWAEERLAGKRTATFPA